MSNCKHCNKTIERKTGRRPKEYCDANCRMAYFKAQNPKEGTRVNKSTHEAVLKENAVLKDLVAELRKNNPVLDRENPFINAARGRDKSGINEDELPNMVDAMKKLKAVSMNIENATSVRESSSGVVDAVLGSPKSLLELKSMCPPELKGFDKSNWIATERVKYGL